MTAKGGFTIGPSHEDGGIPMTVKSTGQKIEVEGGAGIINKKNMADNRKYVVEGTPRQIASAINEIDGNGVSFDKGARIKKLRKGGEIYDLSFSDKYSKNKNQYDLHLHRNGEMSKIGQAKVKKQYERPNLVELSEISIDKEFAHPKTYSYFTHAIIDANNRKGAILNIECVDGECLEKIVDIGEMCDNCEHLIIK